MKVLKLKDGGIRMSKEKTLKERLASLESEIEGLRYACSRLADAIEINNKLLVTQGEIRLDDRQVTMICTAILRGLNNIMLELKKERK
jgi:hypothetical protein